MTEKKPQQDIEPEDSKEKEEAEVKEESAESEGEKNQGAKEEPLTSEQEGGHKGITALLIGLIAAVLLAFGAGLYMITSHISRESEDTTHSETQDPTEDETEADEEKPYESAARLYAEYDAEGMLEYAYDIHYFYGNHDYMNELISNVISMNCYTAGLTTDQLYGIMKRDSGIQIETMDDVIKYFGSQKRNELTRELGSYEAEVEVIRSNELGTASRKMKLFNEQSVEQYGISAAKYLGETEESYSVTVKVHYKGERKNKTETRTLNVVKDSEGWKIITETDPFSISVTYKTR